MGLKGFLLRAFIFLRVVYGLDSEIRAFDKGCFKSVLSGLASSGFRNQKSVCRVQADRGCM